MMLFPSSSPCLFSAPLFIHCVHQFLAIVSGPVGRILSGMKPESPFSRNVECFIQRLSPLSGKSNIISFPRHISLTDTVVRALMFSTH